MIELSSRHSPNRLLFAFVLIVKAISTSDLEYPFDRIEYIFEYQAYRHVVMFRVHVPDVIAR
jgi:hypothetical protein